MAAGVRGESACWDAFPADLLAEVLRKFPESDALSLGSVCQTCRCVTNSYLHNLESSACTIEPFICAEQLPTAFVMGKQPMQYLHDVMQSQ